MPVKRTLEKLGSGRVLFYIETDFGDVLAIAGFRRKSPERASESDLLSIGKVNLREHQHTSLLQQFSDFPGELTRQQLLLAVENTRANTWLDGFLRQLNDRSG